MKFLFVGAHPDDVEYSCGGTILRLVAEGHKVSVMVMTDGGAAVGAIEKERRQEQERAFEMMGVAHKLLHNTDGNVRVDAETISDVSFFIEKFDPDVVVTHYPEDSHQDHRNVAAIVRSATRRKRALAYFDSYSSYYTEPNVYVDISQYIEAKQELLNVFESQVKKYKERGIDFVEKSTLMAKINGYEANVPYAEGFVIEQYTI